MPNLKPPITTAKQVCIETLIRQASDLIDLGLFSVSGYVEIHQVARELSCTAIKKKGILQAQEYKSKIMAAVPPEAGFEPLMTLYLTDDTSPEDVAEARAAGIVAYKLYPAGATTNSQSGVTDLDKCLPALQAMQEARCLQPSDSAPLFTTRFPFLPHAHNLPVVIQTSKGSAIFCLGWLILLNLRSGAYLRC